MCSEEVLSASEWNIAIQNCLGTIQFELLNASAVRFEHFAGFLGEHMQGKAAVLVKTADSSHREELSFFIKRIPVDDPKQMEIILSSKAYIKESGLFSKVFSRFPACSKPWGPRCYFTRPDLLLFENLVEQGFTHVDRMAFLDYTHCSAVLKTMALYHAASIMFEENESKKLGKKCKINELYPELTFETLWSSERKTKVMTVHYASIETLKSVVWLIPQCIENEDIHKAYLENLTEELSALTEYVKASDKYRNVLCHGDLWGNNIFYKYEEGIPADVRIIDFQTARYTPPALDVMSFLHLNTTREFRREHNEKLLSIYYKSLREELAYHDYNVDDLLPWSEFEESCEAYKLFGRAIAIEYHQMNALPDKVLNDHMSDPNKREKFLLQNRGELVTVSWKEDSVFRERLLGDLDEFIEYSILKKGK